MQRVSTNPNRGPGLILVRAHKPKNAQKLPRWTPDTSYPVLQPCILEMVDQNDQKLNLKEDLSLYSRGVIQSIHLNSSVMWRPVGVNSFPATAKVKKEVYISMRFQPKLGQFSTSLHNPPIGQRCLKLLKANLEARLPFYIYCLQLLWLLHNIFQFSSVFAHEGKEQLCRDLHFSWLLNSLNLATWWTAHIQQQKKATGEPKWKGHPLGFTIMSSAAQNSQQQKISGGWIKPQEKKHFRLCHKVNVYRENVPVWKKKNK